MIKAGLDGNGADAKKARVQLLEYAFGTASWTAITNMRLDELEPAFQSMKAKIAGEEEKPMECPDCGFDAPAHEDGCKNSEADDLFAKA